MTTTTLKRLSTEPVAFRRDALTLLHAALDVAETRFASQLALRWLSTYPGDLEFRLLLARATMQDGRYGKALAPLTELCATDPECLPALETLQRCQELTGEGDGMVTGTQIWVLERERPDGEPPLSWGALLRETRSDVLQLELDRAQERIQRVLAIDPPTPLAGILHLLLVEAQAEMPPIARRNLAEHYHDRWPDCLQFLLFRAHALMAGGEPETAVALIHEVAARDVRGQVPTRLWGPDHPYRDLWPRRLRAAIDAQVPARVAARLGWNQLPGSVDAPPPEGKTTPGQGASRDHTRETGTPDRQGDDGPPASTAGTTGEVTPGPERALTPKSSPHIPETLRSIQQELERVAARIQRPDLVGMDGRYPVYVVFTTHRGLVKQYGSEGADQVERAMRQLVRTVRARRQWDAQIFIADDPETTTPLGVRPVSADDPWALKLALSDLDEALRSRGEMIGALLIVGGPEVVPYHHLPNPVDDDDPDVPSDNPYATRDENYFIPEWPVGRLPGGATRSPDLLIQTLERITASHEPDQTARPWYRIALDWLIGWLRNQPPSIRPSFGYTAAIWRKAALTVFQPIGEARTMLTSPPGEADHLPWRGMTPARLGYYNLHGLEDSSDWYGQRDPSDSEDGPDYPIALRPMDVLNSGRAPRLVFTEACFGAHILGKAIDEAMALKFLSAGTEAVVGCTCTAYGSVAPPLIAADLLGHAFWRALREGHPAGEAIRRAKIELAQAMDRKQGYLDGEDQKTLISFVLYGDPLAHARHARRMPKTVERPQEPPKEVKTVCDRSAGASPTPEISGEVLAHVKQVVSRYLPGMADAEYHFSQEQPRCDGTGHQCPTSQLGAKTRAGQDPSRRVVTISKQVQIDAHLHPHYARVTLDAQGKVVKLAVSR